MDTIFALATAQGKAGVAVVRVSGPDAVASAMQLGADVPPAGRGLRTLRDHGGAVLDHALVLRFDGPNSFTGEDVIELHLHGSIAVVQAVLDALSVMPSLRLAEPGEFTRRALENGKLDLTQVEGLADLIDAETEGQRKQAQRVLAGALGNAVEQWRHDLIRAVSLIEATIDFADEEVPTDVTPEVTDLLTSVRTVLEQELRGVDIAERVRSGFEVAIVGRPNVGKSTLLNALAGRDAAITSEFAGTTRDVIEVRMNIGGLPVTLLDTAGLHSSEDHVERIGMDRARERANAADLRVFLGDGIEGVETKPDDLHLIPKADLLEEDTLGISGKTGQGVAKLVSDVAARLRSRTQYIGVSTQYRHKISISEALIGVETALRHMAEGENQYDLAAEDLRRAIRHLETLLGRIDVENFLDEIFSSFCVGK